jgi:hypothetical protein
MGIIMKKLAILRISLAVALVAGTAAQAQTIERMKLTDNDMNCQAIYGEIAQMDAVMQRAAQPVAPAAVQVAQAGDTGSSVGGVAGAVAAQALANSAARGGFGGGGGLFGGGGGGLFGGGGGGGLGGLFGSMAGAATQNNAQQQAVAAAPVQAAPAPQNQMLVQQAQGRKEHLTSLFLGKGCKMADVLK